MATVSGRGPVFVAGKPVRGGGYGAIPRLDDLTADGNLRHTTDFRRVYATLAQGWLGVEPDAALWRGRFEPFAMVG